MKEKQKTKMIVINKKPYILKQSKTRQNIYHLVVDNQRIINYIENYLLKTFNFRKLRYEYFIPSMNDDNRYLLVISYHGIYGVDIDESAI